MTITGKVNLRISAELIAFLDTLEPNQNALLRALLLLGLADAGYDPAQFPDDVRTTLAAYLPPVMYGKLRGWLDVANAYAPTVSERSLHKSEHARQAGQSRPTHKGLELEKASETPSVPEQAELDPFSGLGFDIE